MQADKPSSPAVVRAIEILDFLSQSQGPVNFSTLVTELNLPKSSVHGLCTTLTQLDVIQKLENGHFTLGPHVMQWANAFLARTDITQEFYAAIAEMPDLPEETITLSVIDHQDVVYIACRNGSRPLGVTFRIGMKLPAVYTATGKAMLMTYHDAQLKELLTGDWPPPLTHNGPKNITTLKKELAHIRQQGYSIDAGEVREGMHCFGAPVFDASHTEAIAGVAVSFLSNEIDEILQEKAGKAMCQLAARLSERLGYTKRA